MDINLVTGISKSLRKIYAITKQNMDLLDRAVVQSYTEQFPNNSTSIKMGQDGFKLSENAKKHTVKSSVKRLSNNKYSLPKKKVKVQQVSGDF